MRPDTACPHHLVILAVVLATFFASATPATASAPTDIEDKLQLDAFLLRMAWDGRPNQDRTLHNVAHHNFKRHTFLGHRESPIAMGRYLRSMSKQISLDVEALRTTFGGLGLYQLGIRIERDDFGHQRLFFEPKHSWYGAFPGCEIDLESNVAVEVIDAPTQNDDRFRRRGTRRRIVVVMRRRPRFSFQNPPRNMAKQLHRLLMRRFDTDPTADNARDVLEIGRFVPLSVMKRSRSELEGIFADLSDATERFVDTGEMSAFEHDQLVTQAALSAGVKAIIPDDDDWTLDAPELDAISQATYAVLAEDTQAHRRIRGYAATHVVPHLPDPRTRARWRYAVEGNAVALPPSLRSSFLERLRREASSRKAGPLALLSGTVLFGMIVAFFALRFVTRKTLFT